MEAKPTLGGRKIGMPVAEGGDAAVPTTLFRDVVKAGRTPSVVVSRDGAVMLDDGGPAAVDGRLVGSPEPPTSQPRSEGRRDFVVAGPGLRPMVTSPDVV